MIQLETYKGIKSRHTCPACNSKGVFVRYKDERGEYLSSDVGRCNRESKCGYHRKPKEFFADNPQSSSKFVKTRAGKSQQIKTQTKRQQLLPKSRNLLITSRRNIWKPHSAITTETPLCNFFLIFSRIAAKKFNQFWRCISWELMKITPAFHRLTDWTEFARQS